MIIKNRLINEYPLTKKIECDLECYEVAKRRYVIFLEEKVNRNNIESFLDGFNNVIKNKSSEKKTLIIVAHTDEQFKGKELLFFNGIDTFVVYYLINENNKEIYFNDQRVFWFSIDWKKIIKRFNEILK